MGSGPPRARQSRSLPSLMPLSLKRLLIRPSDERSPISERKFPLANNRRRRLLAFFTRPRSTNGGRSSKRRESRRSEEMSALGQKRTLWVKSGHGGAATRFPLHRQKRTLTERIAMSALCQKRPKCASNRLCCLCGSRCSQGRAVRLLRGRGMAMKIDRIQPAGMNVRTQQGKPAYSHVVTVTGPGKTIYIAGQLARNAEGNIVGPGDMRAQLEQTFKNLDACLKAAG